MDAEKFILAYRRMCNTEAKENDCGDCPLIPIGCSLLYTDARKLPEMIRRVEKWNAEHPE